MRSTDQGPCRRPGLVTRRLADELVVYDPNRVRTHALDPTASAVFDACDGTIPIERIAERIEGADQDAVHQALAELDDAGLITLGHGPADMDRRRALRAAAITVGAAVTLPMVHSVIAPSVAAAASGGGGGGGGHPTPNLLVDPGFELRAWPPWFSSGGYATHEPNGSRPPWPTAPGGGTTLAVMIGTGVHAYQTVPVGSCAPRIDAGTSTWSASGYLFSAGAPNSVTMWLEFYSGGMAPLGSVVVGTDPLPPYDLLFSYVSNTGFVPVGTRFIRVLVGGMPGQTVAGGADVLSLILTC